MINPIFKAALLNAIMPIINSPNHTVEEKQELISNAMDAVYQEESSQLELMKDSWNPITIYMQTDEAIKKFGMMSPGDRISGKVLLILKNHK